MVLLSAAPALANLEYWRDLSEKDVATWGDAVVLASSLVQNSDELADFSTAESFLQANGFLEGMVIRPADAPLRRGTTALLYLRLLRIKGGLMFHLFPNSERYAHREAAYQKLLATGKSASFVSGAELISIYSRCQTFKEETGQTSIYAPEERINYEQEPDAVRVPSPLIRGEE